MAASQSSSRLIKLDIVSAQETLMATEAQQISVSGEMGELGIMPGHAQLLSRLKPGMVKVLDAQGQSSYFFISGGIIEVQPFEVTILADTALREGNLDEQAIIAAQKQARDHLNDSKDKQDYAKALSELSIASAQLQFIRKLRQVRK